MRYDHYIVELVDFSTLRFHRAVPFVAVSQVCRFEYMPVLVLTCSPIPFHFHANSYLRLRSYHHCVLSITLFPFCYSFFIFIIYSGAKDANNGPAVTFLETERAQVAGRNAANDSSATAIKIDFRVRCFLVAKNKTPYADTPGARRVAEMLSDGAESFVFDQRNYHRDTDINAWN